MKHLRRFNEEMDPFGRPIVVNEEPDRRLPEDNVILYFMCLYGKIDLCVITSTENLHTFIEYCKYNNITEEFAVETIEKYESDPEFRKQHRIRCYGCGDDRLRGPG